MPIAVNPAESCCRAARGSYGRKKAGDRAPAPAPCRGVDNSTTTCLGRAGLAVHWCVCHGRRSREYGVLKRRSSDDAWRRSQPRAKPRGSHVPAELRQNTTSDEERKKSSDCRCSERQESATTLGRRGALSSLSSRLSGGGSPGETRRRAPSGADAATWDQLAQDGTRSEPSREPGRGSARSAKVLAAAPTARLESRPFVVSLGMQLLTPVKHDRSRQQPVAA